MLQIDEKIFKLLENGTTFLKLKEKTGLCSSEVVRKVRALEEKGYLIEQIFNEYGVKYKIANSLLVPLQDNVSIPIDEYFSFIVLSDTHVGNNFDSIEKINSAYDYAEKHNIRYIVHLGDMLEGIALNGQNNSRIKILDIHDQVDCLTKKYPKKDKIDTLYILGNHDYRALSLGVDVSKIIYNRRMDMHFLGYKNSKLKIGNVDVLLHHPFTIEKTKKYDDEIKGLYFNPEFDLVLRGHTHQNEIYVNDMNSVVLNVPACYDSPSRSYVSFYQVIVKKEQLTFHNIILGKEPEIFNTISFPLKQKTLVKNNDQVTKFNSRLEKSKK